MLSAIHRRVQERIAQVVQGIFGVEVARPVLTTPPRTDLGDLATPICFELAKVLRQPPRKIAERLADALLPLEGVRATHVAGGGYLNLFLDRAYTTARGYQHRIASPTSTRSRAAAGKIIVEHTSINPNKAAHIGHLRNALLGDVIVGLLRYFGATVEVQNYIDDTGVQVADVVVGFQILEKKSPEEVERLAGDASARFDYYCWDLYARVAQFYEQDKANLNLRNETLQRIEENRGEPARMAKIISSSILQRHLKTMDRLRIHYDLLVQESEILRLEFWKAAFALLKRSGALRLETSGKNQGCWVMSLDGRPAPDGEEQGGDDEDVKIIVRSNGTVTYVGKDIAYHLWKFGLLGRDFTYEPSWRSGGGHQAWKTSVQPRGSPPGFGAGAEIYTVIDRRQSYLQNVVVAGLRAVGYPRQAERLHHVAYEVVGLSQRCAREMGIELDEEGKKRSYVEVSGRKGLGVKADDLMDRMIQEAHREVSSRQQDLPAGEQRRIAETIGIGALRYFLLKYTRNSLIAFDFHDALAFEGETGPYLQYTVVRARNIFRKLQESRPDFRLETLSQRLDRDLLEKFLAGKNGEPFWDLIALSLQLELVAEQATDAMEPSVLAKYGFRLAQSFNNFYHRHHILTEKDEDRQAFLLMLVHLVSETLTTLLALLGIAVPEKM